MIVKSGFVCKFLQLVNITLACFLGMLQDSEPEALVAQPPGLFSPGMSLNASRAKCYDAASDGDPKGGACP